MNMWWGPRLRRTDFVFAVFTINLAWVAALYFALGGLSLMLQLGPRSVFTRWGTEPLELSAINFAFDLVLASLAWRRLQDANLPGWYLVAAIILLWLMALVPALSIAASVAALVGLLALLFLPPSVGPNRFGKDPRGWKSPEHQAEQKERLAKGE